MKKNAARFVASYLECQRIKAKHQHPTELLQPNAIPNWKWQIISMDFVQGLPMSRNKHNAILVVVDRLTKVAHFIPGNLSDRAPTIAYKFLHEIFRLRGVPEKIISDRDARMTSRFWQTLFSALGTQLNISSTYHPETDGQTERVNQVLEDLLRMYCMDQQYKWEEYLPLVEFAHNNSYQSSIKMAPFEALYGRRCRTPIS